MRTPALSLLLNEFVVRIKSRVGWLLISIFGIFISGCTTLYKPNAVHSPMLQKKGDGHVAASFGVVGTGLVNFQAAYAVSNHVGVITQGMYHFRSENYSSDLDAQKEKLNILGAGLGAGYFEKFSEKQNKLIQIYSGAEFGSARNNIENSLDPDPEVSSDFLNFYIQPGITFTGKHIDMAIDLRTKYVRLYNINAYLYDEFEWWKTDYNYATDSTLSFVLFEPAYTFTAGGKNLKGLFQAGLVIPIINAQDFYSSNSSFFLAYPFLKFSFGMQYRFGRK
jgi:hypothetical protein